MIYRMLIISGMLLFVIVTLQCSDVISSNRESVIGTWVSGSQVVRTGITVYSDHRDTLYDTGNVYKTYSITNDTIKISETSYGFRIIPPTPYTPPSIGTWSLINDSLFVHPVSGFYCYSTRYHITRLLPDSLIFSSSDGIDTCRKQ
jgi:hypothetical protein